MNKQNIKLLIPLFVLFIIDRLVKTIILKSPAIAEGDFVSSFISKPEINSGIALGLPLNNNLAIIISVIAIIIIAWHLSSLLKYKTWLIFYWGLIIIGAFSNLLDRITLGGVADYLSLPLIPSLFNLGDSFIFIGAILLALNSGLYSALSMGQSLAGLKDKQDSSK